jgi:curved DNA-binding protein
MPVEFKDYYKTLGVAKTATQEDIKKAFRDLARKCHPDLAKAEDKASSEERFKEINEAYEVLKDPGKRKKYDRLGSDWDKYEDDEYAGSATSGPRGYGDFSGTADRSQAGFEYHFGGTGFSDFFERYFGGSGVDPFEGLRSNGSRGFYKSGTSSRRPMRGSDVEAEIMVTLEEAFKGSTRRLSLKKVDPVKGSEKSQSIDVKIPAGIQEGQRIRLGGQGQPSPDGGPPGDLFLKARFAQHPYFSVKGSDLHYGLNLAPWETALGCIVDIPTLHGTVRLTVKPGTQAEQQLRLAKHGLPKSGSERGDLFVEIRIRMPESLSAEERELWEKLRSVSNYNPRARA